MEERNVREKGKLPIIAGFLVVAIAIVAVVFFINKKKNGNEDINPQNEMNQQVDENNDYIDGEADIIDSVDEEMQDNMEESYTLDDEGDQGFEDEANVEDLSEDADSDEGEALSDEDPLADIKIKAISAIEELNLEDSNKEMFKTNITNATSKEDISSILKNAVEISKI